MQISYHVPNWNAHHYQDTAPIRLCARAWQMVHTPKAQQAVLLVHGYGGYPGELIRPGIDLFKAGFDCYTPRLSGHGTSGKDFVASKAEDWIGVALGAYASLAQEYEKVFVVGHSMGGAIATIIANACTVERVALLAPALLIPSIPAKKIRVLRHFLGRQKVSWQPDPAYVFYYEGAEDDDAFLGSEYWSWVYPKAVWQLEKVRRQAVASLDTLKADTLVVSGALDTTVPLEVGDLFKARAKGRVEHLIVEQASHFMPYDKNKQAQDRAMESVVQWLLNY